MTLCFEPEKQETFLGSIGPKKKISLPISGQGSSPVSPYPAQSKRGRILAFGSKVKEMAKEKVKEKIETVNKNRRRAETTQSQTLIENRSESNISDRSLPTEGECLT